MKIRINAIANLINDCNVVVDVGCDHCHLAIELLTNNKCQHVINIDKNESPLASGISNLTKKKLLNKTTNILNDGLQKLDFKQFNNQVDYIVIAGMGSNNIINILSKNSINFKYLILQSNNNLFHLRNFLRQQKLKIIKEVYIYENKIIYPILLVKKTIIPNIYSDEELYFGKRKFIFNKKEYFIFLSNRLKYLRQQKLNHHNVSKLLDYELQLLEKRIKLYECQGNI